MCSSGDTPDIETTTIAATPAVAKYTDADAQKTLDDTRKRAVSAFGIPGTNITQGALASSSPTTKSATLGGA